MHSKRGVLLLLGVVHCIPLVGLVFYLRSVSFMELWSAANLPPEASVALALPVFITSILYLAILHYGGLNPAAGLFLFIYVEGDTRRSLGLERYDYCLFSTRERCTTRST